MKELSKSIVRRLREPNFITRYLVGSGIDIGGYPDPFTLYAELFPLVENVRVWDLSDGDAQYMRTIKDEAVDFVISSHCLEHLENPFIGLENWFRIIKSGGYLIVTIPEEDLYEQGVWPSSMNLDHKHTFTISKSVSWSPVSINVLELLSSLGPLADIQKIAIEDSTYRYSWPRFDQTLTPTTESAIEFVVRKRALREVEEGLTRFKGRSPEFNDGLTPYLNQYLADKEVLKNYARSNPPFQLK